MPFSLPQLFHPFLTGTTCFETSPPTPRYNCIAWAASEDFRWWWPDPQGFAYWPDGAPREVTLPAFIAAYQTLGYEVCVGPLLESGMEKIAIYGVPSFDGTISPTHASRQLSSGMWTSKMGAHEDISHIDAHHVNGPLYGQVACYMSRPVHKSLNS